MPRAVVTVVALITVFVLGYIHIPRTDFAVTVIGLAPFVLATLFVALVKTVYKLSPTQAWRGAVVLAISVAWFNADMVAAYSGAGLSTSLTAVAGMCLLLLIALWIERRGLGNGVVIVALFPALWGEARRLRELIDRPAEASRYAVEHAGVATALQIVVAIVGVVAVGFVTAKLLARPRIEMPKRKASAYRDETTTGVARVALPTTAGSIAPVWIAWTLAAAFEVGALAGVELPSLRLPAGADLVAQTVVAAAVFMFFSLQAHRVARIAKLWRQDRKEVAVEARRAMWLGLSFVVALVLLGSLGVSGINPVFVALLVAWTIDARAAWHAHDRDADLVSVHVCEEPWLADTIVAMLAARGVRSHANNVRQRSLLGAFGPFVPISILVPEPQRERADKLIAQLLEGDGDKAIAEAFPAPWKRRALLIVLATALALGGGWVESGGLRSLEAGEEPALDVKLEFVLLDDEANIFERAMADAAVPASVRFEIENSPLGPGRARPTFYLRIADATLPAPPAEVVAWADGVPRPAGTRVAWQKTYDYDEVADTYLHGGWRTVLLKGEAFLTEAHVARATAQVSRGITEIGVWWVELELDAVGAKIFEDVSRENVKRRFAIVVDGEVMSAPEIREVIGGGKARITLAATGATQGKEDALMLERALNRKGR